MNSGLAVSLFVCVTAIAATALARARLSVVRISAGLVPPYLGVILIFSKSLAAIVYGLFFVPLAAVMRARSQMRVATLLSVVVFLYPVLRIANLFPMERAVSLAASINEERAHSLQFRFNHEAGLLNKAQERIFLGWGGFSRSRVWDEKSGRDISVTDGAWIIILGARGVVGFVAIFGLLLIPVFIAHRKLGRIPRRRERLLIAGLSLIIVVYAVDLLPNGLFTNLPFFLAGAFAVNNRRP